MIVYNKRYKNAYRGVCVYIQVVWGGGTADHTLPNPYGVYVESLSHAIMAKILPKSL